MSQLKRRERRRPNAEINVVPYIDVMLVLMVILMITATAITAGVEVDLPNANAPPTELTEDNSLKVQVFGDGQYKFSDDEAFYGLAEVVDLVKAQLEQKPDLLILVGGDKATDYGKVIELLSSMHEVAGVDKVSLLTNPVR